MISARKLARQAVGLNERIDGGLVNICAVPYFRSEHWLVTVQRVIYSGDRIVIGRGIRAEEAVRDAWRWIGDHGGGRFDSVTITDDMWVSA